MQEGGQGRKGKERREGWRVITYIIIKKIKGEKGFQSYLIKLEVVFFIDDALVLADNLEEITVRTGRETGKRCGLDMNKDKSTNTLIYNMKDKPEELEGIKIIDNIEYFGVKIMIKGICLKR